MHHSWCIPALMPPPARDRCFWHSSGCSSSAAHWWRLEPNCILLQDTTIQWDTLQCLWLQVAGRLPCHQALQAFCWRPQLPHFHWPQSPHLCSAEEFRPPLPPADQTPGLHLPVHVCHTPINLCQPWHSLWPHPHWSCWTLLTLQRIHISAHLHWLLHTLAWSHPYPRYHSWDRCSSLHLWLDCLLSYALNHLHRQRMPVWVWALHSSHAAPRYQAHPHDCLPPHRQWTGRMSPPSTQGFSQSATWPIQLDGITT